MPQLACAAAVTKQPVLNAEWLFGKPPAQPLNRSLSQPNLGAHVLPQPRPHSDTVLHPRAHTTLHPRAHGDIAPQSHAAGATATAGSAMMNARSMFERGGVPPNAAPPGTPPRVSPPSGYRRLRPRARRSCRATLARSRRTIVPLRKPCAAIAASKASHSSRCAGHQLAWRLVRR